MKNSISKILLVLLVIETITIIFLLNDRYKYKAVNEKLTADLNEVVDEKSAVEEELRKMLVQYEELKTENADINKQLEAEQKKIRKLLLQLKKVNSSDKIRIQQLERETATLRSIMKSYIAQIDSLSTKNKLLTAKNLKIKKKYQEESDEKNKVILERDSLNKQVTVASELKSYNINITPLNKRGKSTKRSRKMKKLKICFTIQENKIAVSGKRDIFVRIAGPDNLIIMNKDSKLFMFEGKEIAYSSKRNVNYKGKDLDVCVFWKAENLQASGKYNVTIYADGKEIGEKIFNLK